MTSTIQCQVAGLLAALSNSLDECTVNCPLNELARDLQRSLRNSNIISTCDDAFGSGRRTGDLVPGVVPLTDCLVDRSTRLAKEEESILSNLKMLQRTHDKLFGEISRVEGQMKELDRRARSVTQQKKLCRLAINLAVSQEMPHFVARTQPEDDWRAAGGRLDATTEEPESRSSAHNQSRTRSEAVSKQSSRQRVGVDRPRTQHHEHEQAEEEVQKVHEEQQQRQVATMQTIPSPKETQSDRSAKLDSNDDTAPHKRQPREAERAFAVCANDDDNDEDGLASACTPTCAELDSFTYCEPPAQQLDKPASRSSTNISAAAAAAAVVMDGNNCDRSTSSSQHHCRTVEERDDSHNGSAGENSTVIKSSHNSKISSSDHNSSNNNSANSANSANIAGSTKIKSRRNGAASEELDAPNMPSSAAISLPTQLSPAAVPAEDDTAAATFTLHMMLRLPNIKEPSLVRALTHFEMKCLDQPLAAQLTCHSASTAHPSSAVVSSAAAAVVAATAASRRIDATAERGRSTIDVLQVKAMLLALVRHLPTTRPPIQLIELRILGHVLHATPTGHPDRDAALLALLRSLVCDGELVAALVKLLTSVNDEMKCEALECLYSLVCFAHPLAAAASQVGATTQPNGGHGDGTEGSWDDTGSREANVAAQVTTTAAMIADAHDGARPGTTLRTDASGQSGLCASQSRLSKKSSEASDALSPVEIFRSARRDFLRGGGLEPLLHIVICSTSEAVLERALIFLWCVLAKDDEGDCADAACAPAGEGPSSIRARVRELGGLRAVLDLLYTDSLVILENVCMVIGYVTREDAAKAEIREVGGLEKITATLRHPSDSIKAKMAGSVWNCASSPENRHHLRRLGAVPTLIELLQQSVSAPRHSHHSKRWGSSGNSAMNSSIGAATAIAAANGNTGSSSSRGCNNRNGSTSNTASGEVEFVRENAAGALWNMSVDAESKSHILAYGGVEVMVSVMRTSQSVPVLENISGTLWNCSAAAEVRPAIRHAGGIALFLDLLVDVTRGAEEELSRRARACDTHNGTGGAFIQAKENDNEEEEEHENCDAASPLKPTDGNTPRSSPSHSRLMQCATTANGAKESPAQQSDGSGATTLSGTTYNNNDNYNNNNNSNSNSNSRNSSHADCNASLKSDRVSESGQTHTTPPGTRVSAQATDRPAESTVGTLTERASDSPTRRVSAMHRGTSDLGYLNKTSHTFTQWSEKMIDNVVGTLRNCAIPDQNKPSICEAGGLEILVRCICVGFGVPALTAPVQPQETAPRLTMPRASSSAAQKLNPSVSSSSSSLVVSESLDVRRAETAPAIGDSQAPPPTMMLSHSTLDRLTSTLWILTIAPEVKSAFRLCGGIVALIRLLDASSPTRAAITASPPSSRMSPSQTLFPAPLAQLVASHSPHGTSPLCSRMSDTTEWYEAFYSPQALHSVLSSPPRLRIGMPIREKLAGVLRNCSTVPENRAVMIEAGAVRCLVAIVLDCYSAHSCFQVTGSNDGSTSHTGSGASAATKKYSRLGKPSIQLREIVSSALWYLSRADKVALREHEGLTLMCMLVSTPRQPYAVLEQAAGALSSLTANQPDNREAVRRLGGLRALVDVLVHAIHADHAQEIDDETSSKRNNNNNNNNNSSSSSAATPHRKNTMSSSDAGVASKGEASSRQYTILNGLLTLRNCMSGSPATICYCAALALEGEGVFVRSLLALAKHGPQESTREALTVLRQMSAEASVAQCVARADGSALLEDGCAVRVRRDVAHHSSPAVLTT